MGITYHRMNAAARRSLLPLWAALLVATGPTLAQGADDGSEVFTLLPIKVIGTLAPVRSALETSVPVDVVGEERLNETGATETGRAIQAAAPSFNFSSSTISDGTDALRPATLRGLGPDQTLVLINGKRRHPSALVHVNRSVGRGTAGIDMNAIPLASIARVEVLRDGAAARYGSDAIAGVINLVLKDTDRGGEARATLGRTYESDGMVRHANVVQGVSLGGGGFLTLTADVRDRGPTNRAGFTGICQYNTNADGCADPQRERAFDRKNFRIGDADSLSQSLWFNTGIPLSDSAEAYAFGGWTKRDNVSGGFYRRANQASRNPEYQGRQYYPDGFLPLIETEIVDFSIGVGTEWALGGWELDSSLTFGRNTFDFSVANSLNAYLWQQEGRSVTDVDSGGLGYRQTTVNIDAQRSIILLGNEAELAVGAETRVDNYTIRAGEGNSYYGCIDASDPTTACVGAAAGGIQVFPGFRPGNEVDESRRSVALYGASDVRLGEQISLGLALRGEDFEDFGSTVNGKVTMRYDIAPSFAVRGSASTGFRAPSLHQKFFNNISTQFTEEGAREVGTFRNDSMLARGLGIPQLREETSRNIGLGFVWTPARSTSFTLDAYRIDIDDRIMISNFVEATDLISGCGSEAGCVAGVNAAMAGIDEAQFFLNAGATRTQGIDFVAEHETELAGGGLRLSGAASWSRTGFQGDFNAPGLLGGLGDNLFGERDKAFVEVAQPRWRINLEGTYSRGPWSFNLGTRTYGPYQVPETDAGDLQKFSPKMLVDTQINYEIAKGVVFAVGADNLFDVYPDRKKIGLSRDGCIGGDGTTGATGECGANPIVDTNGVFAYSRRASPFGFNGGFYYARLILRY